MANYYVLVCNVTLRMLSIVSFVHACVVQSMWCCEPTASVCAAASSTCCSCGLRCSRGEYKHQKVNISTLLVEFNYEF